MTIVRNSSSLILLIFIVTLNACSSGGSKRAVPAPTGAAVDMQRCLQLAAKKRHEETITCLEAYKSRNPESEGAANAELLIADTYFRKKDFLLAAETYSEFLKNYPDNSKADYAYYKTGLSYLKEVPRSVTRDQGHLEDAVKYLQIAAELFPSSPYRSLARELYLKARGRMAKKDFVIGKFYYNFSEYKAAIPRFVRVVDNYEGSSYDEPSFYYVITAYEKLGQKERAQSALALFERRFPNSKWLKKARSKV